MSQVTGGRVTGPPDGTAGLAPASEIGDIITPDEVRPHSRQEPVTRRNPESSHEVISYFVLLFVEIVVAFIDDDLCITIWK